MPTSHCKNSTKLLLVGSEAFQNCWMLCLCNVILLTYTLTDYMPWKAIENQVFVRHAPSNK